MQLVAPLSELWAAESGPGESWATAGIEIRMLQRTIPARTNQNFAGASPVRPPLFLPEFSNYLALVLPDYRGDGCRV